MKMASPNQSPPLSENSGTWMNCWDGEDCSIGGLNLEATNELNNLVEDKEIASKAVAFVVNSTRKGIVPLCAEIANLMRAKYSLERKLYHMRMENGVLRRTLSGSVRGGTSTITSTSTSPFPASLSSYSDNKLHLYHCRQDCREPDCTYCTSQCSSLISESPKITKQDRSSKLHRTSAFSIPDSILDENSRGLAQTKHGLPPTRSSVASRPKKHRRKKSLPEIISEPQEDVPKISPRSSKISQEVQCSLDEQSMIEMCREKQFRETLQVNARLAEELGAAKKEIEVLKGKLRALEMKDLASKYLQSDAFCIENEKQGPCPQAAVNLCNKRSEGCAEIPAGISKLCASMYAERMPGLKGLVTVYPPLDGCRCCSCLTEKARCPKQLKKVCKDTVGVAIDDHVVVRGQKTGQVMYLGHIDGAQDEFSVFVGLQLDAPVGCHDGILEGKRYFTCEESCGLFVPVHDILRVINASQESASEVCSMSNDLQPITAKSIDSHHQHSKSKCHKLPSKSKLKLSKPLTPPGGFVV